MKLLIPTDGSSAALRAVEYAARMVPLACDLEVHLLHVRPPVDSWEVKSHLGADEIADLERGMAEDALRDAEATLREADVKFTTHVVEGEAAEEIARQAAALGCHQIVMGRRGKGALSGLLLGSVSTRVLQRVDIPVTLVK